MDSAAPHPRRFTVDEYYRMAEAGIFGPEDRVELLEGEVVEMAAVGSLHSSCVSRLTRLFVTLAGERAIVRIQDPVRLSDLSEPEPDVTLLRPRADFYASGHPRPADVLLVVEVADTSLAFDRDRKLPLYAVAGIPEVWIVNLGSREVSAHRGLRTGRFEERLLARGGDSLDVVSLPGARLSVDEIFGPKA